MRFCMVALQSPFQIAQHQIQMRDKITLLQTFFYSVLICAENVTIYILIITLLLLFNNNSILIVLSQNFWHYVVVIWGGNGHGRIHLLTSENSIPESKIWTTKTAIRTEGRSATVSVATFCQVAFFKSSKKNKSILVCSILFNSYCYTVYSNFCQYQMETFW